jgi:hypothetical protein
VDSSQLDKFAAIAQKYGITHLKVTPDGTLTMVREAVTLPATLQPMRTPDDDKLEIEPGFRPPMLLSDA